MKDKMILLYRVEASHLDFIVEGKILS